MKVHPLHTTIPKPERFTYPFCYEPHPLCRLAAAEVQQELQRMGLTEGKMFGVLVVAPSNHPPKEEAFGELGFLAAYSGLLEGRNDWAYFVPPVFDAQQPDGYFKRREQEISEINERINGAYGTKEAHEPYEELKAQRRKMSEELQLWLFDQYRLLNGRGERRDLVHIWQDYHCSERIKKKYPLPPGGTGDCCAPKLLQYAYSKGLKPVCMAEFWWGPSSPTDIRQHGQFYPACRGKCKPVLTWMLQGLDVDPNPEEAFGQPRLDIKVVYEDDTIIVVSKPTGLLSVPGRVGSYSVATILSQRYPGALLAHRLDMWTSGLMVAAKSRDAYRELQRQFAEHTIKKRYVALVSIADDFKFKHLNSKPRGTITLPLLCDPINRPRQVVDYERGKTAITDYEVLVVSPAAEGKERTARVALYPRTGRTHSCACTVPTPTDWAAPSRATNFTGTLPTGFTCMPSGWN